MRPSLQSALNEARELPSEELPRFLGDVEEVRMTARLRLLAPPAQRVADEWLDVKQAAAMLKVSESDLYHKGSSLPFAKHFGKRLLFSRLGIEKYMKAA